MAKKFYFTTTLSVKGEIISEKLRTRKISDEPNGQGRATEIEGKTQSNPRFVNCAEKCAIYEPSDEPNGQGRATEINHETRKTSNRRD